MATAAISQVDVQAHLQNRRNVTIALLWGGVMLGILGLWIKTKHPDLNFLVPVVLLLGAIVSVGLAIFRLRLPSPEILTQPTEAHLAQLNQQKRMVGLFMVIVGVILVILGGWLGFGQGLKSLGESLGLVLFGLLALGAGLCQSSSGQMSQDRFFQSLTEKKAGISVFLLVVGLGMLLLGVWLRLKVFNVQPESWFPLWIGAGLIGLVAAAGGAYLRVTPTITPTAMRFLILTVGGSIGLFIAFFTFCQAWIWRSDVFFAGVPGWNGDNGWRVWLCGYVELAGLGLLFGSLLLARADIRVNPNLRRALYGYNAVFSGVLFLVFLVTLNVVVVAAYPLSFNWTEVQGLYGLSEKTVDILEKVKEPVTVYLILPDTFPVYRDMQRFLENCRNITNQLTVKTIDPDKPADWRAYGELSQRYKQLPPPAERNPMRQSEGRGVLLVYGAEDEKGKDPKVILIPPDKLQDTVEKPGAEGEKSKRTFQFRGEIALMTELQHFMMGEKKTKVYFLQGNGELDIGNPVPQIPQRLLSQELKNFGAGKFVERLEKENIEVKGISFSSAEKGKPNPRTEYNQKDVPKDCQVLVIAAPGRKYTQEAKDALERYIDGVGRKDGPGRLMVLFDVIGADAENKKMLDTGLKGILKKYGVDTTDEYVFRFSIDPTDPSPPHFIYAETPLDSDNPVAKKFAGKILEMITAHVVRPSTGKGAKGTAVTVLEGVSRVDEYVVWPETDLQILFKGERAQNMYARAKIQRDPELREFRNKVPIGVAVHEDGKPRMVVLGDADLATNYFMLKDDSFNFLASFLDWLTDRPGVGIRPREHGEFIISTNLRQEWGRITLLPGWLMTLGVLGLGLGAWVVRRK